MTFSDKLYMTGLVLVLPAILGLAVVATTDSKALKALGGVLAGACVGCFLAAVWLS